MNNNKITPLITYDNSDIDKCRIYKDNKNKSGIYRWNNLITGKCYVGSSVSLSRRFSQYYSFNYIKNSLGNGSSLIYCTLLKYGYSNFSLDIIEYCESGLLKKREQYYLYLLKPKYNILKIADSRLGSKQSEASKQLISNTLKNRLKKLLPIKIMNIKTNTIKYFANNLEAAKYLGVSVRTLSRYKNKRTIFLNKYLITNNMYTHKSYK